MAQSQRDVRNRISSVKDIQKITRAMEMVAAARLRRAVARITELRPYADALQRMTRQAAAAAGASEIARLPLLAHAERDEGLGLLLLTGDRGLAGAFNSHVLRSGLAAAAEHEATGGYTRWYVSGRRGASSLTFRGRELSGSFVGFTDRPSFADARRIGSALMAGFVDGELQRVEMIYNRYVSPLTQRVTREILLPLDEASLTEETDETGETGGRASHGDGEHAGAASARSGGGPAPAEGARVHRALVEYEPDPEKILRRLIPDYVETSIYRALLESTASEHGARMTAMRSASENAKEVIADLTLEMNRARQAEITQEIMEVVAGAEGVS